MIPKRPIASTIRDDAREAVTGPGHEVRSPGPAVLPFERRSYLRWPAFWQARLSGDERAVDCLVLDFSPGGAKVRADRPLSLGSTVGLSFAGAIGLVGRLVWQEGALFGIEFHHEARQCAELFEHSLVEQPQAC